MPIAERPEGIPDNAVDVTKDVVKLKDQLHKLLQGKDVTIITMAIGSLIGESFDDAEAVRDILSMITDMAATVFSMSNLTAPEGATIQ